MLTWLGQLSWSCNLFSMKTEPEITPAASVGLSETKTKIPMSAFTTSLFILGCVFGGALLGIAGHSLLPADHLSFGFRPGIPLHNGKKDRTEIDMRLGDLMVEEKLGLRRKRGRRRMPTAAARVPQQLPVRPDQVWTMDFTQDAFASGRKFRTLNLMDGFTRYAPRIEVDTSLPGQRGGVFGQGPNAGAKPDGRCWPTASYPRFPREFFPTLPTHCRFER
jgi:hypothetical protein